MDSVSPDTQDKEPSSFIKLDSQSQACDRPLDQQTILKKLPAFEMFTRKISDKAEGKEESSIALECMNEEQKERKVLVSETDTYSDAEILVNDGSVAVAETLSENPTGNTSTSNSSLDGDVTLIEQPIIEKSSDTHDEDVTILRVAQCTSRVICSSRKRKRGNPPSSQPSDITQILHGMKPEKSDDSLSENDHNNKIEENIVSTPSEYIASLHLSGQPMLVPETMDDDEYIPASPEAYSCTPIIIPSSPTELQSVSVESYSEEDIHSEPQHVLAEDNIEKRSGEKSSPSLFLRLSRETNNSVQIKVTQTRKIIKEEPNSQKSVQERSQFLPLASAQTSSKSSSIRLPEHLDPNLPSTEDFYVQKEIKDSALAGEESSKKEDWKLHLPESCPQLFTQTSQANHRDQQENEIIPNSQELQLHLSFPTTEMSQSQKSSPSKHQAMSRLADDQQEEGFQPSLPKEGHSQTPIQQDIPSSSGVASKKQSSTSSQDKVTQQHAVSPSLKMTPHTATPSLAIEMIGIDSQTQTEQSFRLEQPDISQIMESSEEAKGDIFIRTKKSRKSQSHLEPIEKIGDSENLDVLDSRTETLVAEEKTSEFGIVESGHTGEKTTAIQTAEQFQTGKDKTVTEKEETQIYQYETEPSKEKEQEEHVIGRHSSQESASPSTMKQIGTLAIPSSKQHLTADLDAEKFQQKSASSIDTFVEEPSSGKQIISCDNIQQEKSLQKVAIEIVGKDATTNNPETMRKNTDSMEIAPKNPVSKTSVGDTVAGQQDVTCREIMQGVQDKASTANSLPQQHTSTSLMGSISTLPVLTATEIAPLPADSWTVNRRNIYPHSAITHKPVAVQSKHRIVSADKSRLFKSGFKPRVKALHHSIDQHVFLGSQSQQGVGALDKCKQKSKHVPMSLVHRRLLNKRGRTCLRQTRPILHNRKRHGRPVHHVKFEQPKPRSRSLDPRPSFLQLPTLRELKKTTSLTTAQPDQSVQGKQQQQCMMSERVPQSNMLKPHSAALIKQAVDQSQLLDQAVERTVVEETVIQVVYRKITVETLRNRKVIKKISKEEQDEPVIIRTSHSENFNYVPVGQSPTCSSSTLTSGDLADVSSLSRSSSKGSAQGSFDIPTPPGRNSGTSNQKDKPKINLGSKDTDSRTVERNEPDVMANVVQGDNVGELVVSPLEATERPVHTSLSSVESPLQSEPLFTSSSSRSKLHCTDSSVHQKSQVSAESRSRWQNSQDVVLGLDTSLQAAVELEQSSATTVIMQKTKSLCSPKGESVAKRKSDDCYSSEHPPKRQRCLYYKVPHQTQYAGLSKETGNSRSASPEIPFQNQKQAGKNTDEKSVQQPNIGALVMAKWKDSFFYPGKIASAERNKFQIRFDDGDMLWAKVDDILLITQLPVGQCVMVQSQDGYYDSGLIVDYFSDEGENISYRVKRDNGAVGRYPHNQVILTESQAGCLKNDEKYLVRATPQLSTDHSADISLDNLVSGKRKSTGQKAQSSGTKSYSSKKGQRKLCELKPQAASTPTPKRKVSKIEGKDAKRSGIQESPLIGTVVSSPRYTQKSPRKFRKGLFDDIKGVIPTNKNLFHGMLFLLTHTKKTVEQKKAERKFIQGPSLESSTDENILSDEETAIPFDKEHLEAQIEAGGGTVLDKFDQEKNCYLLSDAHQRTLKYLQCLAAGVLCVSHIWIRDSCKEGQLLDYMSYMLPAGISLEKQKLVECKLIGKPLEDTVVFVSSAEKTFLQSWQSILVLAGCRLLSKLTARDVADVVVTDQTCSAAVLRRANKLHIPLVSTEWVIQCLINGHWINCSSHPKYRHDFVE